MENDNNEMSDEEVFAYINTLNEKTLNEFYHKTLDPQKIKEINEKMTSHIHIKQAIEGAMSVIKRYGGNMPLNYFQQSYEEHIKQTTLDTLLSKQNDG